MHGGRVNTDTWRIAAGLVVDIGHHRDELANLATKFWTHVQDQKTNELIGLRSDHPIAIFHLGQGSIVQMNQCGESLGAFSGIRSEKAQFIALQPARLADDCQSERIHQSVHMRDHRLRRAALPALNDLDFAENYRQSHFIEAIIAPRDGRSVSALIALFLLHDLSHIYPLAFAATENTVIK
jgi:hypothetical protein